MLKKIVERIQRARENLSLKLFGLRSIEGSPCLEPGVFQEFLRAPFDIQPDFVGPPGKKLRGGRGKDHPRYGRFIYAFASHFKPQKVVEVGTYAGGTAVGWVNAFRANGQGTLICVDNDSYSKSTYPTLTNSNLQRAGVQPGQVDLRNGDSKEIIRKLAGEQAGKIDVYLVDGDHTYEGALADLRNGLPMMKSGGFVLVHDVDRGRRMDEQTLEHPHPVYEAVQVFAAENRLAWCVLKFIRKHLAVIRV